MKAPTFVTNLALDLAAPLSLGNPITIGNFASPPFEGYAVFRFMNRIVREFFDLTSDDFVICLRV